MTPSRIEGADKLRAKLKAAGPLAGKAMAAAGVEEMDQVIGEAKRRAPVDTGTLRASGTVLPPKITMHGAEIVAGFGGAAEDYAIIQHEDLTLNHETGEPKFLERPFLERSHTMPRRLADGVARALKRL